MTKYAIRDAGRPPWPEGRGSRGGQHPGRRPCAPGSSPRASIPAPGGNVTVVAMPNPSMAAGPSSRAPSPGHGSPSRGASQLQVEGNAKVFLDEANPVARGAGTPRPVLAVRTAFPAESTPTSSRNLLVGQGRSHRPREAAVGADREGRGSEPSKPSPASRSPRRSPTLSWLHLTFTKRPALPGDRYRRRPRRRPRPGPVAPPPPISTTLAPLNTILKAANEPPVAAS